MTVPGPTEGGTGGRMRGIGEPCGTGFCASATGAEAIAPTSISTAATHRMACAANSVSRPVFGPTSPWFTFPPSVLCGPEDRPGMQLRETLHERQRLIGPCVRDF